MSTDEIIATDIKSFIECFESKQDDNGKQVYSCRIDGCHKTYTQKSSSIRHLQKHHKEVYQAIQCGKLEANEKKTNSPISFEIRVKVNPEDIMDACAELITVHGLPLSVVEYPAFKRVLNPYVIALKMKGVHLSINKNSMKERIKNRTNEVKKIIRSETKNKMVSLMVDIATRYNRSVLGISISYMYGGQICIRTISLHVLKAAHTGSYVSNLLREILSDYNICLSQIVSITTDNGKNMIKAVALLDAFYQEKHSSADENWPIHSEPMEDEDEDEYYINNDVFDEDYYTELLKEVRSSIEQSCSFDLIHGISCGAHCIHLTVSHAVKNSPEVMHLIEKCRTLAKKLRTPTYRTKMKAEGLNMAIIDVETRWNSIFSMVTYKYPEFICTLYNKISFFSSNVW